MTPFAIADDGVDPRLVPQRVLWTGARMPAIGLGTFGSDRFSGEDIAAAVVGAAEVGYRHFDCASVYENEHLIGASLQRIIQGGIPREELWVTTKLWNDKHAPADVASSFEKSLRDLRLDYLDLYLIHWPFPNHHAPGVVGAQGADRLFHDPGKSSGRGRHVKGQRRAALHTR